MLITLSKYKVLLLLPGGMRAALGYGKVKLLPLPPLLLFLRLLQRRIRV